MKNIPAWLRIPLLTVSVALIIGGIILQSKQNSSSTEVTPQVIDELVSGGPRYDSTQSTTSIKYIPTTDDTEAIAETKDFVIYRKSQWVGAPVYNTYTVHKLNYIDRKDVELKPLAYTAETNSGFQLSPNGKYISRIGQSQSEEKIQILSLDDPATLKDVVVLDPKTDLLHGMIWSDDSSMIAYGTSDATYSGNAHFKVYLLDLNAPHAKSVLLKSYEDMTSQGMLDFTRLTSDGKLYLKRALVTN